MIKPNKALFKMAKARCILNYQHNNKCLIIKQAKFLVSAIG